MVVYIEIEFYSPDDLQGILAKLASSSPTETEPHNDPSAESQDFTPTPITEQIEPGEQSFTI